MKINVAFDFATVYDITKLDVVKGQKFKFYTDAADGDMWFSNNDAVLGIEQVGTGAAVEATAVGKSTILILNASLGQEGKIEINVVDEIVPPADNIGATTGDAEPK